MTWRQYQHMNYIHSYYKAMYNYTYMYCLDNVIVLMVASYINEFSTSSIDIRRIFMVHIWHHYIKMQQHILILYFFLHNRIACTYIIIVQLVCNYSQIAQF